MKAKKSNNPLGITIGQNLYIVYTERRNWSPHHATVVKVGRKWATVKMVDSNLTERINITDPRLPLDGEGLSSPGRCYLSQDYYVQELRRDAAWHKTQMVIRYRTPATLEDVQKIREAFGLERWDDGQ